MAALGEGGYRALLVAGCHALLLRVQPDLQEVCLAVCCVVFAVQYAAACAHPLYVAGGDHAAVAQAVFVRQRAGQDVADDLHVTMRVPAKAAARCDAIVVDDAQVAPAHVCRVVITGKRKTVVAVQPAVVGMAAFGGRSFDQHDVSFLQPALSPGRR